MMLRTVAFVLSMSAAMAAASAAQAQSPIRPQGSGDGLPVSQCQAIAHALPRATYANYSPTGDAPVWKAQVNAGAVADREQVKITFVGHSTYFIETPGGIGIATDYSGVYKPYRRPDVITMNRAHSTHYTLMPDPGIPHVLRGWADMPGEKAEHHEMVGDAYIRNVVSDIRNWGGGVEQDGNSIFIFEVAGLCIGHLGHLHFELTEQQYTEIGRLDVLMVPVDGGLTMGADSMSRVVQRLRSSLILPMHRFGPPLDSFLAMFDTKFDIVYARDDVITVSMRSLPRKPTIMVPKGL